MIEIILLFILSRENGKLAELKGLNGTRWIIYTIIAWMIGEFIGLVIAVMMFSPNNIISIILTALLFGLAGYHFTRSHLQRLPDKNEID